MDEFKSKFGVYVEKLKNIHSESGEEQRDGGSTSDIAHTSPSYQMFFIAVLIMLLIFGSSWNSLSFIDSCNLFSDYYISFVIVLGFFGYKLYLSIIEKDQKKERKTRKQLKEEKKSASSPPSSPNTKKQS